MNKPNMQLITKIEIKSEVYLIDTKLGNMFQIQINYLPDEICGWLSLEDGGVADYILGLDPNEEKIKAVEMILSEAVEMIEYKEKTGRY